MRPRIHENTKVFVLVPLESTNKSQRACDDQRPFKERVRDFNMEFGCTELLNVTHCARVPVKIERESDAKAALLFYGLKLQTAGTISDKE